MKKKLNKDILKKKREIERAFALRENLKKRKKKI